MSAPATFRARLLQALVVLYGDGDCEHAGIPFVETLLVDGQSYCDGCLNNAVKLAELAGAYPWLYA